MGDPWLAAAGIVVLLVVVLDVLTTTLRPGGGAGPLTRYGVGAVWRVLLRVHRRDRRARWMTVVGTGLLFLTVLLWSLGLWLGWGLVFLGSDGAVVDATDRSPAGPADVFYFVGFTVFTLGVGDFVAATSGWRLAAAAASLSGLLLLTLSVTYLLSVVSAVVQRRALADSVQGLGSSPQQIVAGGWSGDRFSPAFEQQLVNLSGQLGSTAEQHLAYPVLHQFHTREPDDATSVALARLDDAVLLLRHAVAPSVRPGASAVTAVQRGIDTLLDAATATGLGRRPVGGAPPPPDPRVLTELGIPVGDPAEWARAVEARAPRRGQLGGLLDADGWSWPAP